jgi:hemolysin activation/secretion protein
VLFNGDYAGAIPLGGPWSVRVAGAGQHASTAFIPSNQLFQIGGPGSVRGFQPGTVSGSGGYFTQTELHYQRPLDGQALDLFAFFDHGKTWSADFPDRALASAGAGVRLPVWRFTLDAMIGLPITDRLANEKGYRADARLTLAF